MLVAWVFPNQSSVVPRDRFLMLVRIQPDTINRPAPIVESAPTAVVPVDWSRCAVRELAFVARLRLNFATIRSRATFLEMPIHLRYTLRTEATDAAGTPVVLTLAVELSNPPAVGDELHSHPMCGPHVVLEVRVDEPAPGEGTCIVDDRDCGLPARPIPVDLDHAERELWELREAGWKREG